MLRHVAYYVALHSDYLGRRVPPRCVFYSKMGYGPCHTICMTLSPGAKVQPNLSTLRSPAGFNAAYRNVHGLRADAQSGVKGNPAVRPRADAASARIVYTRTFEICQLACADA